jgi:hypothetical protein
VWSWPRPAQAEVQLRHLATAAQEEAASGDVTCRASSCHICWQLESKFRVEHWKNKLDPSGQLNFPLAETALRVKKEGGRNISISVICFLMKWNIY